jgi:hypothetical protein
MTKEALKLALEALELANYYVADYCNGYTIEEIDDAITAIKEALAQPEPVAWMFQHDETGRMNYVSNDGIHNPAMFLEMNPRYALVCPLYTTLPQRTWVGLTEDELSDVLDATHGKEWWDLLKVFEAKLKEKNT